jgi:DNA-binding transcriptional MerR regulator
MNKHLEQMRKDFQGSADDLIVSAQEVAKILNLDQEATEGNERLVRHYVSVGVVDKPTREGRDALYGFRHLVQFVAARRLLAEGLPLAKIAKFTGAVPTETLTEYLENPNKTNEAELLVAVFRSESTTRNSPPPASRRPPPAKPPQSMATGMGMVDVVHEMREMEQRVRDQLQVMQKKVHLMVEDAVRNMSAQPMQVQVFADEFKQAVSSLARMMDEATHRFDSMLKKPMLMIEKQMEQQKYMFEEAHRQKDFLDQMFGSLLKEQRQDVQVLFAQQMASFQELIRSVHMANEDTKHRMSNLEAILHDKLNRLEVDMKIQKNNP